ncbi:hypothetical protein Smp_087330 [Schistosoma mansoni]|uniref:Fungal_trans domain-containing protein n=1 Tax=Schistosoma mansoni TaxID=6183 RepID=G4VJF7_SCHMA|nr:hypothetical protein Smp_087330 [Schistosoma mansoni]|eukprot:XP_018652162.1 hypothetical protein Smp_087330 [Schistosoma mansoni]
MIAIVCYATSIRIVNLPECKLRGLISTYLYDQCDSIKHDLTIQKIQSTHSIHAYHILKNVFSLSLLEFQYLYDASMDQVFAACLVRYLRHLKTVPAIFLPRQYQRTLCDNPMWKIVISRLVKAIVIEESMAWLSTLGGGYSSLGDHNDYAASLAGTVSLFQMSLALEINSPILLAKSQLWFAQSLMQRGFLKNSAKILRRIYIMWKPLMRPDLSSDMRIDYMALGLWVRLRHLWKTKHKTKSNLSISLSVDNNLLSLYPHVNMLINRL